MPTRIRRTLTGLGVVALLTACGGGSSAGPDCRFNEAWENGQCNVEITVPPIILPDGIWRGTDSSDRTVIVLVNRFSAFQFVDGDGNQGSGALVVTGEDTVTSSFQFVTQAGDTFADGSTQAVCTFSGTLAQREVLTLLQDCTTTAGLMFQETLSLSFDALYLRTSSLTMIAGTYETLNGSTLSITSVGELFVQDAVSACVTNGQISTTVSFTNMYVIEFDIDNCTGAATIWNGARFSGLGYLDNTTSPESLEYAVIGERGGVPVSILSSNKRI